MVDRFTHRESVNAAGNYNGGMYLATKGEYVLHSDYAALETSRDALADEVRHQDERIAALTSERDALADRVAGLEGLLDDLRIALACEADLAVHKHQSDELNAWVARIDAALTPSGGDGGAQKRAGPGQEAPPDLALATCDSMPVASVDERILPHGADPAPAASEGGEEDDE